MAANYDLELTNSSRRAAPGHVTEKHHFHHFMERPNVIRDVTNCHWYWHTHYGGDHVMVHMATPICQILFPSLNVVLVESHYLAKDKASALTSSWSSIKLRRNAAGSWWQESGWNDWWWGKHRLSDLISNHTDLTPTNCLWTSVTGYRQSPLTSKWTDGEGFYCCCDVAHQRSLFISSTQAQDFSPATMDLRAYKCHTALFTCKTPPVWGWIREFIDLIKGKYVLLLDKDGVNSMVMLLHFSCCKSKIMSQVQQVPSVHFSRGRM